MPKGLKKAMIVFGGVLAAIAAAFALLAAPVSAESGKPTKEMLEQQNALAAYDDLYKMVLSRGFPYNYSGEYVDGSDLVILITNDDQAPYSYVSGKHSCVRFQKTERSYKALQALFDKAVSAFPENGNGSRLCESACINIMSNSIDIEISAAEYIKLSEEERAEFLIDDVNYQLVNSSHVLDAAIAAEKDGARGWYQLDGKSCYIKSDGTFATKSININGIRYRFSSEGICLGKYSGWTKSAKGRRYWDNGKLLKNQWIEAANGKIYYAGEKGYMTVGWSDITRIGGTCSYFDEKGVWDGKVYRSKTNPA